MPEIIDLMRRIERGVEKCWQIRTDDPSVFENWDHAIKLNFSTLHLMNNVIEIGRMISAEHLNLDDDDVELAYVAWLAFFKLAATIRQARLK